MTRVIPPEKTESSTHKEVLKTPHDIAEKVWNLNLSEKLKGLTWWWWWWIFFFDNPDDPEHPRQLMILWSTKNCPKISVMDFDWHRRMEILRDTNPETGEKRLRFNGMTAVWYYDGKRMYDPFLLKESDFRVQFKNSGELIPETEEDLRFYGGPREYTVRVQNLEKGLDFTFNLSPWSEFLSTPRYASRHYIGRYGYNILRFYGMKLSGTLITARKRAHQWHRIFPEGHGECPECSVVLGGASIREGALHRLFQTAHRISDAQAHGEAAKHSGQGRNPAVKEHPVLQPGDRHASPI